MTSETEPRSQRGRRIRQLDVPDILSQIRVQNYGDNIELTGAWAYYLNPKGATIRDALILYPNGGIPDIDDARLRAKYGENAEYYRNRQARKGLEYVGPTLTEGGVKRLVEVLEANRPDEILFIEDEISDAEKVATESDLPQIRDQAKRRIQQLSRRLAILQQPLDVAAMEVELNEIARAQQLSKVDPNVLRVIKSMIGEVNDRFLEYFTHGVPFAEPGLPKMSRGTGSSKGADFEGKANLDA